MQQLKVVSLGLVLVMAGSVLSGLVPVFAKDQGGPAMACDHCASRECLSKEDVDWVTDQLQGRPAQEVQQILGWMNREGLNRYGDPQDTMYAGGNPLFDESTGESLLLYTYLMKQHPDRPWQ